MPRPNPRGNQQMEMASRLGFVVLTAGMTLTYQRSGFGKSMPDVTFVLDNLVY